MRLRVSRSGSIECTGWYADAQWSRISDAPRATGDVFRRSRLSPRGMPLIKRVLAVAGQIVCRRILTITVDDVAMGIALEHDHGGRLLPNWQGCRMLAEGDIFLMNTHEAASLDDRYFGVLAVSSIIGRAAP